MSGVKGEKAYIRRIESRFLALRGGGLCLSPRDFALLLDWYHRGVPADLVIATVDGTFARTAARARRIQSIAYCRHAVEEAWEERRVALIGATPPRTTPRKGTVTVDEIVSHLEAAARAMLDAEKSAHRRAESGIVEARGGSSKGDPTETVRAGLRSIASRLLGLRDGLREGPPPSFAGLEEDLLRIEGDALELGRSLLTAGEIEDLVRQTEETLAPLAPRMSQKARAATVRRAVESAIRDRTKLPRLSLLSMVR